MCPPGDGTGRVATMRRRRAPKRFGQRPADGRVALRLQDLVPADPESGGQLRRTVHRSRCDPVHIPGRQPAQPNQQRIGVYPPHVPHSGVRCGHCGRAKRPRLPPARRTQRPLRAVCAQQRCCRHHGFASTAPVATPVVMVVVIAAPPRQGRPDE